MHMLRVRIHSLRKATGEAAIDSSGLIFCIIEEQYDSIGSIDQTAAGSGVTELLGQDEDVFVEPTELHPIRDWDRQIVLKPSSEPVILRPYQYPHRQKTEIETQLKSWTILSLDPTIAPLLLVLLVKDKTWRFCMDYPEFNSIN